MFQVFGTMSSCSTKTFLVRCTLCTVGVVVVMTTYLVLTARFTFQPIAVVPQCASSSQLANQRTPLMPGSGRQVTEELRAFYAIPNRHVYVYAAYWDDRVDAEHPAIRITGLRLNSTSLNNSYCLIQTQGDDKTIATRLEATAFDIYTEWPSVIKYYAFMLVCPVPSNLSTTHPDRTTLVLPTGEQLDFPIKHPQALFDEKRELAVCVKPIHGEFDVRRMIEWVEIQKAVGINDFVLYDADLHGASRYVVEYYRNQGAVRVIGFPYLLAILRTVDRDYGLGPMLRYSLYQQTYLLALQDCVYRFRKSYDYLLIIDLDEVLLPTGDESVPEMFRRQRLANPDVASYVFPTAWHFREFRDGAANSGSSMLYMQRYASASAPCWFQPKSIVSTRHAITVNYHVSIMTLAGAIRHEVPWQRYGYLHHFRDGTCKEKFRLEKGNVCGRMMQEARLDPSIKRYNIVTLKAVYKVMKLLELG